MNKDASGFTAVVLAADRGPGDPVAEAAGVLSKSLVPIGGQPMVLRVLDALERADQVNATVLCGPPASVVNREADLRLRVQSGRAKWMDSRATPSLSAYHALKSIPENTPVLVTTSDHALLTASMVDYFCSRALATGCDVVVGLALHEQVLSAYPNTVRTVMRLRDGHYCGCNMFAFLSPEARMAADFWRRVESQRKKPMRVVRIVGWMALLRYLTKRLTLAEGLERISRRMGFRAGVVLMPFPQAAVDVDTVGDWELVQKILNNNIPSP